MDDDLLLDLNVEGKAESSSARTSLPERAERTRKRPREFTPDASSSQVAAKVIKSTIERPIDKVAKARSRSTSLKKDATPVKGKTVEVKPRRSKAFNRFSPSPAGSVKPVKVVSARRASLSKQELVKVNLDDLRSALQREFKVFKEFQLKPSITAAVEKARKSSTSNDQSGKKRGRASKAEAPEAIVKVEVKDEPEEAATDSTQKSPITSTPAKGRPRKSQERASFGSIKLGTRRSSELALIDVKTEQPEERKTSTRNTKSVVPKSPINSIVPPKRGQSVRKLSSDRIAAGADISRNLPIIPTTKDIAAADDDDEKTEMKRQTSDVTIGVRPKRMSAGKGREFIRELTAGGSRKPIVKGSTGIKEEDSKSETAAVEVKEEIKEEPIPSPPAAVPDPRKLPRKSCQPSVRRVSNVSTPLVVDTSFGDCSPAASTSSPVQNRRSSRSLVPTPKAKASSTYNPPGTPRAFKQEPKKGTALDILNKFKSMDLLRKPAKSPSPSVNADDVRAIRSRPLSNVSSRRDSNASSIAATPSPAIRDDNDPLKAESAVDSHDVSSDPLDLILKTTDDSVSQKASIKKSDSFSNKYDAEGDDNFGDFAAPPVALSDLEDESTLGEPQSATTNADIIELHSPTEQEPADSAELISSPTTSNFVPLPGRSKGRLLSEDAESELNSSEPVHVQKDDRKAEHVIIATPPQMTTTPSSESGGRSSRRIVKPVRFDDFVTEPGPVPVRKITAAAQPISDVVSLPVKKVEARVIGTRSREPSKAETDKLNIFKRNIKKDKNDVDQPIKIKLRIGGHHARIIENTVTATPEDKVVPHVETQATTPALVKKHIKSEPKLSWSPSIKPTIEDYVHPDGTVDKLGISINKVMDRLLYDVCGDGIKCHNAMISKKERKDRMSKMASMKYAQKKQNYQLIVEECTAQGITPPVFSHTINPSLRRGPSELKSPEPEPKAERTKKAGLYKQNEFLLKTVKSVKKDSDDEEPSTRGSEIQKTLAYLSKQFHKEMDESSGEVHQQQPKKRKRVSHEDEYTALDERRHREQEHVEHRPEKVHVPFSTYLSSKAEHHRSAVTARTELISSNSPVKASQDFFYRDIVHDIQETGSDSDSVVNIDEEIDVEMISSSQEYPSLQEAQESHGMTTALKIERLLLRPTNTEESYGISDLYQRASEETELRQAIMDRTINVICDLYCVEQTCNNPDVLYNSAIKHASELRDVLAIFTAERREAVMWLHSFLISLLPAHYLATYLVLLRHCRSLTSSYISTIVKSTAASYAPWDEVTHLVQEYVGSRLVDPATDELNNTILPQSLPDVLFLCVSPAMSAGDYSVKCKYADQIFRWLRQMGDVNSEILKLTIPEENGSCSLPEVCDLYIEKLVSLIRHLAKMHKDKRIVLVGWQTTCYFNHRAVQLIHGVSAIIDLAFPVMTITGPRGDADDDILITYCPSLFVIGADADDFDAVAMYELRAASQMKTGLVMVGHADKNLFVKTSVLNRMGITQRVVFRAVVEHITEFLALPETKHERSQLIPQDINNVYKVDPQLLKSFSSNGAVRVSGSPVTEKQNSPVPLSTSDGRGRKRKIDPALLSPLAVMPSLSAENTTTLDEVRSRFDSTLKQTKTANEKDKKVDEMREAMARERELFRQPRAPPAGYKVSPLASPALPIAPLPSPSVAAAAVSSQSHPLDPAFISLS